MIALRRMIWGLSAVTVVVIAMAIDIAPPPPFQVVGVVVDDEALAGAHDVELQGNYAYVPGKGGSLAVIDVAEPTQPKIVWSRRDPALLTDAETVLLAGNHLFVGTQDFFSFDVRDPTQPRVLKQLVDRPRIDRINGFVRIRDYIFAANKSGWIDAFDVSTPAEPKLADALNVAQRDGMGDPHDIDRLGDMLVVVDPDGFGRRDVPGRVGVYRVFDAAGKLLPSAEWRLVGKCEHPALVGGNRVRTIGNYAFVAASISPAANHRDKKYPCVSIIDLSKPEAPEFVQTFPFPSDRGPNGMAVAGNAVFACGGRLIMAIDVTDPRAERPPLQIHPCREIFQDKAVAKDDGHDLVYRDGYLYVSGQTTNSFGIVRVDDPAIRRAADAKR